MDESWKAMWRSKLCAIRILYTYMLYAACASPCEREDSNDKDSLQLQVCSYREPQTHTSRQAQLLKALLIPWSLLIYIPVNTQLNMLLLLLGTLFALVYYATHIDAWPSAAQRCLAKILRIPSSQLEKEKLSEIVKYRIDVYLLSRSDSKLLLLSFLTIFLVMFGGISLYVVSDEELEEAEEDGQKEGHASKEGGPSFGEAMWAAAAGAGLSWEFSPSANHTARFMSLLIGLGGTLITALLLGIVTDVLHRKVDELKSGHGAVLESGHMLILGWSEKVFPMLEELARGCSMLGGYTIVILSDKEKEEMEDAISDRDIDIKSNRLVLRQGCILSVAELRKVSAQHARTILILADQSNPCSDARTLRCMTCLQHPSVAPPSGGERAQIIAELCVTNQEELLLQVTGGPHVRSICSLRLTASLIVQCTRCPKLRDVLFELLIFSGSEIYVSEDTETLEGLPFQCLQAAYAHAVPMGLIKACDDYSIELNPPSGVVEKGDKIILLAMNTDCLSPDVPGFQEAFQLQHSLVHEAEEKPYLDKTGSMTTSSAEDGSQFGGRFLIIGWRKDMGYLIDQLDSFCTYSSELYLYSDVPIPQRQKLLEKSGMVFSLEDGEPNPTSLQHLRLHFSEPWLLGDSTTKADLQAPCPLQFTNIVVLAQDSLGTDAADTDSRTISCLLNLRQIQIEDLRSGRNDPGLHINGPKQSCYRLSHIRKQQRKQFRKANLLSIAARLKAWEREQAQEDKGEVNSPRLTELQTVLRQSSIVAVLLDNSKNIHSIDMATRVFPNEVIAQLMALTMLSFERLDVLDELFNPGGNKFFIRPASWLLSDDIISVPVSFLSLSQRANKKGDVLLGYIDAEGLVKLNPEQKAEAILTKHTVESFITISCGQ